MVVAVVRLLNFSWPQPKSFLLLQIYNHRHCCVGIYETILMNTMIKFSLEIFMGKKRAIKIFEFIRRRQ